MKKLILSGLAVCTFGFASAQEVAGFKAGIHAGIPTGDFSDFYSFNFGVDAAYMWPVAENFKAGVTTGYSYYSGKEYTYPVNVNPIQFRAVGDGNSVSVKVNAAFIPIAASAQYSIMEMLYLGLDLGYAIYVGDGDGDGGLYYQPKIGYQMEKIEVYLGYKGISENSNTLSSVNLGAAYKF